MTVLEFDKSLYSIFKELFPHIDNELLSYLIGILCDKYSSIKPPKNSNAIAVLIGDMLLDYELISSPKYIESTCNTIAEKLYNAGFKISVQTNKKLDDNNSNNTLKQTNKDATTDQQSTSIRTKQRQHSVGVEDDIFFTEDGTRMKEVWVNATERHRPRINVNTKVKARYW
jgi:hypothetical protein